MSSSSCSRKRSAFGHVADSELHAPRADAPSFCAKPDLRPAVAAIGTLGILGGLGWFWKRRLPAVEDEVVAGLVAERNAAQDAADRELAEAAQDYRRYIRRMTKVLTFDPQAKGHPDAPDLLGHLTGEALWLEGAGHAVAEIDARHKLTAERMDDLLGCAHEGGQGVQGVREEKAI